MKLKSVNQENLSQKITKASIKYNYYNKLEKEYLVTDFKSSESLIGFKLTYQMLENLLFAQPFGLSLIHI